MVQRETGKASARGSAGNRNSTNSRTGGEKSGASRRSAGNPGPGSHTNNPNNPQGNSIAGNRGGPAAGGNAVARPVGPRRERYLVAPVPAGLLPAGYSPADGQSMLAHLDADPAVTIRRVIRAGVGSDFPTTAAGPEFPDVAVVEMDADRAAILAATPQLHVEPDQPLSYAQLSPTAGMTFADPGLIPPDEEARLSFLVRADDDTPLAGAEVYLISTVFPVRGVTDNAGQVSLAVPVGSLPNVRGVLVRPRIDHWSVWLGNPDLLPGTTNLVTCPRLADSFPNFPARELDGWARQAMRFDALPPTFRAHGVKIAIIDSGAATEHPDLSGRITAGYDVVGESGDGWRVDTVGHGSHCAAIIGGRDNGTGIVGIAPEAELHAYKVFPGGRCSDLIEALDRCAASGVDVATVGLGCAHHSELVARKINQARQTGTACVVAAGNSAGPVAFPASLPFVLTVAAIGRLGEFPPESYHATQVFGMPTPEGYFSARFTCFGPQVDVCAPGVAIVSSVPPGNYAARDGTSFAAPYVAALAALLLAHHPELRDQAFARTALRVDRLFEIIRGSCRPLALGDPGRSGAGLPDAAWALGLLPPVAVAPTLPPGAAGLWATMAHAGFAPAPISGPGVAPGGGAGPTFAPTVPPPPTGPAVFGEPPADAMAPLRAALRAAGLIAPPPQRPTETPGPPATQPGAG